MLQIGHLNIYHLDNKITDLSTFLHNSSTPFHLYGITESRLNENITDDQVAIPNYTIVRRDAQRPGETGVAAYIHNSLFSLTSRRSDLDHESVECLWLEVKTTSLASSVFVCFLYRNPAACAEWYDWFADMLDNVYKSKPNIDVLILGDFNIDLLKPHSRWQTITGSLGLTQLISSPTRVTPSSETLIDHIYSNNPAQITSASLSDLSISDHTPIFCTKISKVSKASKNAHTHISYRSFKHFDQNSFLYALSNAPFNEVFNYTDANQALEKWYNVFLSVLDSHAPIKNRRVKHPKLPKWLTPEIMQAMAERDNLKKSKKNCRIQTNEEQNQKHGSRLKARLV
jgi:hypothetical protein